MRPFSQVSVASRTIPCFRQAAGGQGEGRASSPPPDATADETDPWMMAAAAPAAQYASRSRRLKRLLGFMTSSSIGLDSTVGRVGSDNRPRSPLYTAA